MSRAYLPAALLLLSQSAVALVVRAPYLASLDRPAGPLDVMRLPELALVAATLAALYATWRLAPDDPRAHVAALAAAASALWLTPFLLAGHARLPDALWHVGSARFLDRVEPGLAAGFAGLHYVAGFPGAFTLLAPLVAAGDAALVARGLFPAFAVAAFALLAYAAVRRVAGERAAFVGVALLLLVTTYVELHPSPRAVMTLLVLAVALGLAMGGAGLVVAALAAAVAPLVHPLAVVLIGVVAVAAAFLHVAARPQARRQAAIGLAAFGVVATLAFLWLLFGTRSQEGEFLALLRRIVAPDVRLLPSLLAPAPTVFAGVGVLRALLPAALAAATVVALFGLLRLRDARADARLRPLLVVALGLGLVLLGSGLVAGLGRDRPLFFLLLACGSVVGLHAAFARRANLAPAVVVAVAALAILPTAAHAFDAYAVVPPVEAGSFAFVGRMDLDERNVDAMRFDRGYQLVATMDLGARPAFVGTPPNLTALDSEVDVLVWRRSLAYESTLVPDDPAGGLYATAREHAVAAANWSFVYDAGAADVFLNSR